MNGFKNGDRVKNVSGETFIVHQCHENGVVTVIPDRTPNRTIAIKVSDLTLFQSCTF